MTLQSRLLGWFNSALMWKLFFVLASVGWFAVALLGRSAHVNLGFDLWYRLWDPVFMPSIGILMAGAIVSGIVGWITRKFFDR